MDDLSLDELIARVSLRDRRAFSEIYDRTSAKLYSVALRILNDDMEAEDAVQEAYVKIWRNAARFEQGRAAPMTWLITIARNAAIDRARKRRETTAEPEEALAKPSLDPSPEEVALMADDHARLRKCLNELEETHRNVVRTAFFTGRTYAEIAEGIEKPLGTVKSWVRRSLMKLRECLEAPIKETAE
jgi:RNA polymerase sigma-70 factor (ECF subfamily)